MYETVFEISFKLGWNFFLFTGLGILFFIFARVEYGRYRKGEMTRVSFIKCHSIIPTIGWSIGVLVVIILNSAYLFSWYTANSAYKKVSYDITEGKVFVLREQPKDGRGEGDIIKISDVKLYIDPCSDFTNACGYRQTIAFGGVLKDGVYARVYHYRGKILRIDLKKEESSEESLSTTNQDLNE